MSAAEHRHRRGPWSQTVKVAVPREPTKLQAELTASLYPYVDGDDAGMDRRTFLENVVARIEQDLITGEF